MIDKKDAPAGGEPAKGAKQSRPIDDSTSGGEPFGPVDKIKWLAAAAGVHELSRVELALLVVVADMINSTSGQAWPSYNTLADRTGSSPRHVKRAVKRLTNKGLLIIVQRGNRVRSNRYKLNKGYFASLTGSDAEVTTVVTPLSSCSDVQVPDVVTPRPPESINESEHKAKDEFDRSQADGGAAPSRPVGASGAPHRGIAYPEFWKAMGRRTAVAESEQLIREAVADGVEYQDIVQGARRYARYCADTGGSMKLSAAAWLQKQKWLDDWEFIPKASTRDQKATSKKKKPKAKASATRTATGKPRKKMNPEFKVWREKKALVDSPLDAADSKLYSHVKACSTCRDGASKGDVCVIGKNLASESKEARQAVYEWQKQNPLPERWIEVTE